MKGRSKNKIIVLQNIIDRMFNIILLSVSILFLCVGIYALVDNHLIVKEADIPDSLKKSAMADRAYPDIRELQKTNKDIIAWLTLDDTLIDYPITQSEDNVRYLTTDYKGEHSIAGNPFVDYRNDFLNDDYTVIYGHRMNRNKMFGPLVEYADGSYLQKHRRGTITTAKGTFELEVISYSVEDVTKTKIYDLAGIQNGKNKEIIKSIIEGGSTINGSYPVERLQSSEVDDWQLMLLSTCDKDSRHYRDVLLLKVGEEL